MFLSLPDDLNPLNDEEDFLINKRRNSALHIRVFCTVPSAEEKPQQQAAAATTTS